MNFNVKKKLIAAFIVGAMTFGAVIGAFHTPANAADKDGLVQIALLQSLAQGYFRGTINVGQLRGLGDTGIGTFEGLNGDMIALDGVVYQALGDGRVVVAPDNTIVPYATVMFFNKDIPVELQNIKNKADLEEGLGYALKYGANDFYMVKLHAEFSSILFRSEYGNKEPYPTLVEALKEKQTKFTEKNIKGTIVGIYCPNYMEGLNSVGWHFHFISDDKKKGGHVLDLSLKKAIAHLDQTDKFTLILPQDKKFHDLNLAKDMNEDVRRAKEDTKEKMQKNK